MLSAVIGSWAAATTVEGRTITSGMSPCSFSNIRSETTFVKVNTFKFLSAINLFFKKTVKF